MTTKRKRELENESELRMKRPRRRKRSGSESGSESGLLHDPVNAEKRQVLKRLFGRNCNSAFDGEVSSTSSEVTRRSVSSEAIVEEEYDEEPVRDDPLADEEQCAGGEFQENDNCNSEDENSDPLLDSVPVDLDPEQLGFLVCAQETLRFLNSRGFAFEHPVFTRLRSRLLRGMDELAVA